MTPTDPVSLLCDLIETGVGGYEATALRSEAARAVEFLLKIGALIPGQLARVVTCRACHNDHPAHLEFDSTTRCYWHFCPEAGRVIVNDEALATLCVNAEWLVDWIIEALPITPPVRRRVLVPDLVWHLGDAHLSGTEFTIVFAIGVGTLRNFGALANAISTLPLANPGVVLATSDATPRWVRLPNGYKFLELRQIARPEQNCLAIDKGQLVGWIKGLTKGLDKPVQLHAGRPSHATIVDEVFRERRAHNLPLVNQRMEAAEIRAEIRLRYPEHDPPVAKTIERHLRRMRKDRRG